MEKAMLIIASIMYLSSCAYEKEKFELREVEFVLDYAFVE